MRVLFIGVGLVPYFNGVLNRLARRPDLEIVDLVAAEGPGHAGAGVYQTEAGVRFRIERLPERSPLPGYRTFRGLAGLLDRLRPQVVVVTDAYARMFLFEPRLRRRVRRLGIRLVLKSIPFGVRPRAEAVRCRPSVDSRRRRLPGPLALAARPPAALLRLALAEIDRRVFARTADVHVTYTDAGPALYASYGVPPHRVFVVGNSPDTDRLFAVRRRLEGVPPPLPDHPRRVIHVGRLVAWKRVDLLLEALARLRRSRPDTELVVVGDGPERGRLERQARALGQDGAVRFLGAVHAPERVGALLTASSVYVLAGMGGLSINDAMVFGLPVVCSVCDGTERRLVRPGVNGAFFAPGDAGDLAAVVERILSHPHRERFGRASTQIIRREMNIHTVVAGYRAALTAARRPRRASG